MSNSKSESGKLLREYLGSAGTTQSAVARTVGVTRAHVNNLATGMTKPSPEWVDIIASTLALTPEERVKLHQAAARDHGFKIDLG